MARVFVNPRGLNAQLFTQNKCAHWIWIDHHQGHLPVVGDNIRVWFKDEVDSAELCTRTEVQVIAVRPVSIHLARVDKKGRDVQAIAIEIDGARLDGERTKEFVRNCGFDSITEFFERYWILYKSKCKEPLSLKLTDCRLIQWAETSY